MLPLETKQSGNIVRVAGVFNAWCKVVLRWDSCLLRNQLFHLLQPKPNYRNHKNEQDNTVSTHGTYEFSAFGQLLMFIVCS
jgi:hypothetical protein